MSAPTNRLSFLVLSLAVIALAFAGEPGFGGTFDDCLRPLLKRLGLSHELSPEEALRSHDLEVAGAMNPLQQKELANMFSLLGIKRAKIERLYQRAKGAVGLASYEHVPVIPAGQAPNALGDGARALLARYNGLVSASGADQAKAYSDLIDGLFALYQKRAVETIDEPWFVVAGKKENLTDFISSGAYRQTKLDPSNKWMNVANIGPDTVRNPLMKGLTREMWWNRETGIQPIGSTRIARNMKVLPDGTEQVVSVEVIRRGDDGVWIPYSFKPDATGALKLVSGPDARKQIMNCFGCHFRLNGIYFGGISMKGYVPSPNWYINNIDRIKFQYHSKFEGLK